MITVIFHSGDFDGLFCEAIARKFLGDSAQYIGWNFGDKPIQVPINGQFIVMDLPLIEPFGLKFCNDGWVRKKSTNEEFQKIDQIDWSKFTWIDHHKSSIESTPVQVHGCQIDGVAACRLAWQWFTSLDAAPESKSDFVNRSVKEPESVRLAGEYDVWDKRDSGADLMQYGLRTYEDVKSEIRRIIEPEISLCHIIERGDIARQYARNIDIGTMKSSFIVNWEGLIFLCLNGRGNSMTFASRDLQETGHDALMMFFFNGSKWVVKLYHATHRNELDLSAIAVKYGGGGHKGACGFTCDALPFLT